MSDQTIVVLGGGYGAEAAKALSVKVPAGFNIVLIDPRPFRVWLPAGLRMTCSDADNLEGLALAGYDNIFPKGNGRFVQGKAVGVTKKAGGGGAVQLENGEEVHFKILVLATGCKWSGPLDFPHSADAMNAWLKQCREEYTQAQRIVIVGAGAVGLELAGEIRDFWPDKSVTVVHAQSKVINAAYPDKYRDYAAAGLTARGVELILGDTVDSEIPTGGGKITTRNGKEIEGDLFVSTRGGLPNTAFLKTLDPSILSSSGHVKVKPTLQVQGHDDIYVMGDIIEWEEQRNAIKAQAHMGIVVPNILSSVAGNPPTKEYKGSYEIIALTNGRNSGSIYVDVLWGIILGGWITKIGKSKDLMVPMFRSAMGY
ncbi:FAD/NAD(P)-binding domain-containing protein [Cylindrobasidium torrendii FP15055 ss-10]|uniref:FAD/NAD(P)-binding domain-containing protein n=1 Tax=Cylindrobasidium torrendii FP15055 ss-10 TaxID=1314674 RepID=A0A0D7AVQ1_9AGAR|nr:FAD/NAD(P)-binding domain-containing protein [Cylindrobasidium torrendii FP15055 ss-10]